MNRRTFLCGLALGALAGPLTAEAQHAGKVAEGDGQQVPTLRRGLNLSHWFAQAQSAQGYSAEHLTAHTTASDVGLFAGWDSITRVSALIPRCSLPQRMSNSCNLIGCSNSNEQYG